MVTLPPLLVDASVAQLVEQIIRNDQVTSSNLVAGSMFAYHLLQKLGE